MLSGDSSANMRARASFSEFGPKAVDVVAPAVDIVSTAVLSMTDQANGEGTAGDFTYFYGNGTSFSSPLVAGEAALLLVRAEELGLDGSISADSIERVILNATTALSDDPHTLPDGGPNWAGHGRVDFLAAVQQIGPDLVTAPNPPVKMSAEVADPGAVELTWADGSDNEQGFVIERAQKEGDSDDAVGCPKAEKSRLRRQSRVVEARRDVGGGADIEVVGDNAGSGVIRYDEDVGKAIRGIAAVGSPGL